MGDTILLVEDDFALAMGTQFALEAEGYRVVHAANLKTAKESIDATISLILLDVMLPDGNGYDFCREIRKTDPDIPIIFVTAVGEEANIVQGLELGADDYVTKPYRLKELMSRIGANLRRSKRNRGQSTELIYFGMHAFDPVNFRLLKEGAIVECTFSELKLLQELIMNRGQVLTRNQILERLYDVDGSFIDDNTLSVYMRRLRSKLDQDADYIVTVRGVGYSFRKE